MNACKVNGMLPTKSALEELRDSLAGNSFIELREKTKLNKQALRVPWAHVSLVLLGYILTFSVGVDTILACAHSRPGLSGAASALSGAVSIPFGVFCMAIGIWGLWNVHAKVESGGILEGVSAGWKLWVALGAGVLVLVTLALQIAGSSSSESSPDELDHKRAAFRIKSSITLSALTLLLIWLAASAWSAANKKL